MLLAILLSLFTSTVFAQYDRGNNLRWSVECDSAIVSMNGPKNDRPYYYIGQDIGKRGVRNISVGDKGNSWFGNDSYGLLLGGKSLNDLSCTQFDKGRKNILKVKTDDVEIPPTIIHFIDGGSKFEINGHPFYDDCHWKEVFPLITVICHKTFWEEDPFDPYYYYEENNPYAYYSIFEDDYRPGEVWGNTFNEGIDWGYKPEYDYDEAPVSYISFDCEGRGPWQVSFNPNSIEGPGEYDVKVTYTIPEDKWESLGPDEFWGTNFQFDLDGGGAVEYTLWGQEGLFTVDGEGLQGKIHSSMYPLDFKLTITPNLGKVLDYCELHYESGLSDDVKVIPLNFEFDEVNECYILSDYEDGLIFCENGYMSLSGCWMSTFVVRFKDDERIIEFADPAVKQICVDNWDTNGDGEISRCEAAAVTNIGTVFSQNKTIKSFDELKYFSSLTSMTRIGVADGNADFKSVDGVLFSFDGKRLIQYPAAKGTAYRIPDGTVSVARDAFFMNNLSEIILPSTIKTLEFDAFGYSTNLEKIVMPEGLESISDYAFDHCTGLEYVAIPSTVTTIGHHVFQSCKDIESVYSYIKSPFAIAENNFDKSVYDNAVLFVPKAATDDYSTLDGWRNFKHRGISDIVFADSKVKSLCVGNWDLDSDGELSYYEADLVTSIGSVFKENKTITSFDELKYFTGLKSIPSSAFLNCTSLESVTIPANVEAIGTKALSGCSSMTRIDVAEGSSSFLSNDGVLFTANGARLVQYPAAKGSTYSVPSGTVIIGQDAFYISKLSSVLLPNTLRTIESGAFAYSKSLSSTELPEGLTSIGNNAFEYCSGLYNVTIPSTLTYMGQQIFNACNNIRGVHSHIETPSDIEENNFTASVYANAILYVPENSLDLYGTAKGWRNFAKIVGDPGEVVPEYTVAVPDVTIAQGGTAKMVIELNNGEAVVNGYQFEVEFPAGVELQTDKDGGYIYELTDRYSVKDGMQISIYKVSSQVYRVMASSMTNVTLTGTDGPVLMLSLAASDEIADSGTGIVRNIVISTNEGVSITTNDVEFAVIKAEYAMGDANGDGSVNVTDVMLIVNHILGNTLPVFHEECANMNGDSRIDVADVMLLVNMILSGESQAPAIAQFETSGLEAVSTSGNKVELRMNDMSEYIAFQIQVQMPEDARLLGAEMTEGTTGHRVMTKEIGDGLYNVIVYSLNGENFKETSDGTLLRLVTVCRAKDLQIKNIQFTNPSFETVIFSDITETSGIENVSSDETDGIYYNLQGMPVKNPSHGVFIHDNKKILVK